MGFVQTLNYWILSIGIPLFAAILVISLVVPWFRYRKTKIKEIQKDEFLVLKELLKDYGLSIKKSSLLKKFSEKRRNFLLDWLSEKKYIKSSSRGYVKITSKGVEYLGKGYFLESQAVIENYHKWMTLLVGLISLSLLFFGLQFQALQTAYQEQEKSANFPDLSLIVYHHSLADITENGSEILTPLLSKSRLCSRIWPEEIDLYLQNRGKLNTGPVNLRAYSSGLNITYAFDPYISNISSGETVLSVLRVMGEEQFCNSLDDSLNITVVYTCIYCKSHRFAQNYPLNLTS